MELPLIDMFKAMTKHNWSMTSQIHYKWIGQALKIEAKPSRTTINKQTGEKISDMHACDK